MIKKKDVLSEVMKKRRPFSSYDEERGFTSIKRRNLQISRPKEIKFVIHKHKKITT